MYFRCSAVPFIFIISAAGLLLCCRTNGIDDLPVPSETRILRKNLATEYYSIAEAYFDLKKYDKAADYYKLAMKDPALRTAAYYKLGRAYALGKQWNDAEKIFRTLLKRDPENLSISISIAYITAMKGDTENALLMYRNLIEKKPDDGDLLENYIALLITDGRLELAEQQLFILKTKFPDNSSIDTLQKKIYEKLDNPPAKEKEEKAAAEEMPAVH
jgi:tetratricopeptide (TPR) repeat protein